MLFHFGEKLEPVFGNRRVHAVILSESDSGATFVSPAFQPLI
jgi:hypothetical protein